MGKLYFGGPLDTIKNIIQGGFSADQVLRNTLLEAMLDARNSVGLNRRFRPAVLVINHNEAPCTREIPEGVLVTEKFRPDIAEIFLVKIDFNSPQLVRVAGTIPVLSLMDLETYKSYSTQRAAGRA